MTIDFRSLLSPAGRARIDHRKSEILRLWGLTDRWLAEALLRMARELRDYNPSVLGDPYADTYTPNLLWQVVPEVARRLGATDLLANEGRRYRAVSDAELRNIVGIYLANSEPYIFGEMDPERCTVDASEILLNDVVHGNPLAFAIARLMPAERLGPEADDRIARLIREVARSRKVSTTGDWTPAFDDYKAA